MPHPVTSVTGFAMTKTSGIGLVDQKPADIVPMQHISVIVMKEPLHRFAVPRPFQGRQRGALAPLKGELASGVSRKPDD